MGGRRAFRGTCRRRHGPGHAASCAASVQQRSEDPPGLFWNTRFPGNDAVLTPPPGHAPTVTSSPFVYLLETALEQVATPGALSVDVSAEGFVGAMVQFRLSGENVEFALLSSPDTFAPRVESDWRRWRGGTAPFQAHCQFPRPGPADRPPPARRQLPADRSTDRAPALDGGDPGPSSSSETEVSSAALAARAYRRRRRQPGQAPPTGATPSQDRHRRQGRAHPRGACHGNQWIRPAGDTRRRRRRRRGRGRRELPRHAGRARRAVSADRRRRVRARRGVVARPRRAPGRGRRRVHDDRSQAAPGALRRGEQRRHRCCEAGEIHRHGGPRLGRGRRRPDR